MQAGGKTLGHLQEVPHPGQATLDPGHLGSLYAGPRQACLLSSHQGSWLPAPTILPREVQLCLWAVGEGRGEPRGADPKVPVAPLPEHLSSAPPGVLVGRPPGRAPQTCTGCGPALEPCHHPESPQPSSHASLQLQLPSLAWVGTRPPPRAGHAQLQQQDILMRKRQQLARPVCFQTSQCLLGLGRASAGPQGTAHRAHCSLPAGAISSCWGTGCGAQRLQHPRPCT